MDHINSAKESENFRREFVSVVYFIIDLHQNNIHVTN